MAEQDLTDRQRLTPTLTLTVEERTIAANALVITTAIASELAPDLIRKHMALWNRFMEGIDTGEVPS